MKIWKAFTALLLLPNLVLAATELLSGQQLVPNDQITSPDGYYRLVLQSDGNLVVYRTGNTPRWYTGTRGGLKAVMQTDGNFVVYDASDTPLWWSNTGGSPGAMLALQNDGNLVIYRPDGSPAWDIAQDPAFFDSPPGTLRSGEQLSLGTYIHSARNKLYVLAMQTDGNLVYSRVGGTPVWYTGTGSGTRAQMESDGNFSVFNASGSRIWSSNTSGRYGAILSAQDDGNLVVYDVNAFSVTARWDALGYVGSGGGGSGGGGGGGSSGTSEQGKYPMENALPPGSPPYGTPVTPGFVDCGFTEPCYYW